MKVSTIVLNLFYNMIIGGQYKIITDRPVIIGLYDMFTNELVVVLDYNDDLREATVFANNKKYTIWFDNMSLDTPEMYFELIEC